MQELNIIAVDWSKHQNKRAAYLADMTSRRIRKLAFDGSLADLANKAHVLAGPALVGVDAALGLPARTWQRLTSASAKPPANFMEFLEHLPSDSAFFEPVNRAEDWHPDTPFIAPLPGPWSLNEFVSRSNDSIHRQIDRKLDANSVFVTRGMPGTIGSGTQALWKELIELGDAGQLTVWPFDGAMKELLTGKNPVLTEIYPKACYGIALATQLPTPMRIIAKTKAPAREDAIAELMSTTWLTREHIQVADLAPALENEDDFDALMSCAALTRLLLEDHPLESDDTVDAIAEGGVLGAASLTLESRAKAPRQRRRHPNAAAQRARSSQRSYPCPIPGCAKVFLNTRGGWDSHIASARQHPQWQRDTKSPEKRKALFREEFADWLM